MNELDVNMPNKEVIQTKASKLALEIELAIPTTIEDCWLEVEKLENEAFQNEAKRGLLYLALKQKHKHGEFTVELVKRNVDPRRAREAMAIAKILLDCPDSKRRTFAVLNLNKSQIQELSTLDIEVIEEITDEQMKEAAGLPVKKFKKRIAELEAEIKAKNEQLQGDHTFNETVLSLEAAIKQKDAELAIARDDLATTINELEHERVRKAPTDRFGLPVQIVDIRSHAVAATALLDDVISKTESHVAYLIAPLNQEGVSNEHKIQGVQTIWHTYTPLLKRLSMALETLKEFWPDDIKGVENLPVFPADEWKIVDMERETLLETFQADLLTKSKGGK